MLHANSKNKKKSKDLPVLSRFSSEGGKEKPLSCLRLRKLEPLINKVSKGRTSRKNIQCITNKYK